MFRYTVFFTILTVFLLLVNNEVFADDNLKKNIDALILQHNDEKCRRESDELCKEKPSSERPTCYNEFFEKNPELCMLQIYG